MAATFVHIPAERLVALMLKSGFEEIHPVSKRYGPVQERVFARQHSATKEGAVAYPNVQVRVYTSIDKRTGEVRGDSEDRIMVCAFYTGNADSDERRGASAQWLFGAKGVNRCSKDDGEAGVVAIIERLLGRMRDTWRRIGQVPQCKCGEPLRYGRSRKRTVYDRATGQRKPNPNFNRPYIACMSKACTCGERGRGFFVWDVEEPATKGKAKPAAPAPAPKPAAPTCEDCGNPIAPEDVAAYRAEAGDPVAVPRVCERCAMKATFAEAERQAEERAYRAKMERDGFALVGSAAE